MKPERQANKLLGITQAKAKMFEYRVPERFHLNVPQDPSLLLTLTVALLGDLASAINNAQPEAELRDARDALRFAARYFDAYVGSRTTPELRDYALVLGSAAYYLCELPGSAAVLADQLREVPDLNASGLESMLLWLLRGRLGQTFTLRRGPYDRELTKIGTGLRAFAASGEGREQLIESVRVLREAVYLGGSATDLLFCDVFCAVVRERLGRSAWSSLPTYSGWA